MAAIEASENEAGIVSKIGTNTAVHRLYPLIMLKRQFILAGGIMCPLKVTETRRLAGEYYKSGITSGITGGNVVGYMK